MSRHLVLASVAATAFAVTGAAGTAHADPAAPCNFRLSPPQVVQLSGTDVVTATVDPAGCKVAAEPIQSVACIQIQGSQAAEQCAQIDGPRTAQIFFQPYRPGATYVATGRGCASVGNPPKSVCQTTGPLIATL
jgi:hypothetical protein